MQGVPGQFDSPRDRAQFLQVPHRPGVELYRAHIVHHSFEPHVHDGYGLGAIESGAERFRYAGAEHRAGAGALVAMNPDVMHTGHADAADGWRYRMIYLDRDVLEAFTGDRHWHFDEAVREDRVRAVQLTGMLDGLWQCREPLAFDCGLAATIDLLRRDARIERPARDGARIRFSGVIDYLHAHLSGTVRLEELANVAGLSPFHFLRQFRAHHHATPQQMLMALRMMEAKRRLAAGQAPAQVAAATGMADQAHLTRGFARRYGVTPARYQRQVRG